MFFVGVIMFATLALQPTMLQQLMHYPVATAGLVIAPRGIGTMVAMFLVGRIINLVDNRLLILSRARADRSLALSDERVLARHGYAADRRLGARSRFRAGLCFRTVEHDQLCDPAALGLTQGTALFSLTRNIGSSIGIAILEALFVENSQIVHSRLIEHLRPDNPLAQAPYLLAPYSLSTTTGIAALDAEVTRQAQMVAYIDDFKLMMVIAFLERPCCCCCANPGSRVLARSLPNDGHVPSRCRCPMSNLPICASCYVGRFRLIALKQVITSRNAASHRRELMRGEAR